jgi:hypothetical protein
VEFSQGGSFIRRDGDTVPGNMIWEGTQRFEAVTTWANNIQLKAENTSGSAKTVAYLDAGDILRYGDNAMPVFWSNNGTFKNGETARIASATSGVYTGDGATSLAITGLGFFPSYVKIWEPGVTSAAVETFETTPQIVDDDATGLAFVQNFTATGSQARLKDDAIITLAEGSFTVDDNGADEHPNKASTVYAYYVVGL